MPDDKKPLPLDQLEIIVFLILLFALLQQLAPFLLQFFAELRVAPWISQLDSWLRFTLKFLAVLSIAGISFTQIRLYQIAKARRITFEEKEDTSSEQVEERNKRWSRIIRLAQSDNPSDWKVAIIEADTILDTMVQRMGYSGDNLGERLKNIEKSDFITLDDAWEAHKFRNRIAHDAQLAIKKSQVDHVIGLYQKVFREFGYI